MNLTRISTAVRLAVLASLASGCYVGGAKPFSPATFSHEPGWLSTTEVQVVKQRGQRDCGAAVAVMLLYYWDISGTQDDVRLASGTPSAQGLPAGFLRSYLRARGLDAYLLAGTFADLVHEVERGRPVLVGVTKPYTTGKAYAHYQLVVGVHRGRQRIVVIDPADGWREYPLADFVREWKPGGYVMIVASRP